MTSTLVPVTAPRPYRLLGRYQARIAGPGTGSALPAALLYSGKQPARVCGHGVASVAMLAKELIHAGGPHAPGTEISPL